MTRPPHTHPRPEVPVIDARAFGLPPVDMTPGAELLGAALAGCRECQDVLIGEMADAADHYVLGHMVGATYAGMMGAAGGEAMLGMLMIAKVPHPLGTALDYVHRSQLAGLAEMYLPSLPRDQRVSLIDQLLDVLCGMVSIQQAERITLRGPRD